MEVMIDEIIKADGFAPTDLGGDESGLVLVGE